MIVRCTFVPNCNRCSPHNHDPIAQLKAFAKGDVVKVVHNGRIKYGQVVDTTDAGLVVIVASTKENYSYFFRTKDARLVYRPTNDELIADDNLNG